MSRTHLIIPDQHAHPDFNNNRADLLGKLILDLKPDVVINMGDCADMASLSNYEKGKASFHGRNYGKDIESHLDFQERMWHPIKKAKKKTPLSIVLEGNHEHRIKKAINQDPHLAGATYGLSFDDLRFKDYYHHVIEYDGNTPGCATVDGVTYAHYFVSGLMGYAIGGENPAAALINKNFSSCTAAHSHTVDWAVRSDSRGKKIMGCVAGVYQDYEATWAGAINKQWWSGVVIKRGVSDGVYSPEFVSLDQLRKNYGTAS